MPKRMVYGVRHWLERRFPEQRVFLKSDTETRFIRLRPGTQIAAIAGASALLIWSIVATSMLLVDSLGAGDARVQARRDQAAYEARLDQLVSERDERVQEALAAQDRFNLALSKVSQMQSLLLASEDRRREVETGLDVVHKTLRRTIRERDQARAELLALTEEIRQRETGGSPSTASTAEAEHVLDLLVEALGTTAMERDRLADTAVQARVQAEDIALENRLLVERNNHIFGKLEEAVTVSLEPLEKMFRAAGLKPDEVLRQIRSGYSGQGGPISTLRISTKGEEAGADEQRANAILSGLDRMVLFRIAASRVPFANPVRGNYRFTSGFGFRRDPKGAGMRMHSGLDFAGSRGTPIHSTADGVVIEAGWHSGYGNNVVIRHDFGIETRYAHLSQIRVTQGQRVSRGERIGDMGNTGRSTGTHLHYEVHVGDKPVNPMTYIKAATNVF